MKTAANVISFVFHPLLMTTYLVWLLGKFFPPMLMIRPENLNLIVVFVFCFTFVLPVLNLLLFRYFGSIKSLTLELRTERIFPFTFIALIYIIITLLFYYRVPFSQNFNKLLLLATVLIIVSLVITLFYKISIHSLAIWGAIGILMPLNKIVETPVLLWPTAGLMVIAGLVISARLALSAHTPRETLVGSLTGFLVGFGGMFVLFGRF